MRVMAIDLGDVRSGVAVSDESASISGEAWLIVEKDQNALAANIVSEAHKRNVAILVLGYPKNMNGSIGPRAKKSEEFAKLLEGQLELQGKLELEIVLWDERMTTMSAQRILSETGKRGKKKKNTIDAVAAALILESYLQYLSGV